LSVAELTPDEAYQEVERVTRAQARNFAWGIMLLPRPKRRAIAAIYAFAREVDDAADGDAPPAEKAQLLEQLHESVDAPPDGSAMRVALADARSRYAIPAKALHDLVDGAQMDLGRTRYDDFDELVEYCRRVAGAVGLACTAVYGADQPQRAEQLGIALQLINIMRDVAEDWALGRVYLPQEELASFGVSEADIAAGAVTPAWQALMAYQSARARAYLKDGLGLLAHLDWRCRACVATFAGLYEGTLDQIERRGFDVFSQRPALSARRKLLIAASNLLP
jgi:phytoene synthase